jgi:hypothetical protein
VRLHALYAALLVSLAGCPQSETVVRLTVELAAATPAPSKLRVTVIGDKGMLAAPSTIGPVTLPGTIVLHALPATASTLCVQVDGLAADGSVASRGSVTVVVAAHVTTPAAVSLSIGGPACEAIFGDGGAHDLGDAGADLGGGDAGATVAVCPAGNIFCDDFESGGVANWTDVEIKYDLGAQINVQQSVVRHGMFALHAAAASPNPGNDVSARSIVVKMIPSTNPPVAVRANVFALQPLDHFGIAFELYDDTTHGFAIGADDSNVWTVTEDQAISAPDHHTDMVPWNAGQWHCIEMVIDAGGMVSFFVDNHQLLPTFARNSAVGYTTVQVGVGRTVNAQNDVYIDDVAVGTTRLYCP